MERKEVLVVASVLVIFLLIAGFFVALGYSKYDSGPGNVGAVNDGGGVLFSPGDLIYHEASVENGFEINIGIAMIIGSIEQDIGSLIFEFNGTNISVFGPDLKLMLNIGGIREIGDNETNIVDISGNDNNGATQGNYVVAFDKGALIPNNLDGVDDFILVENSDSLQIDDVLTVGAMITPKQRVDGAVIIEKGNDYSLTLEGNESVKFKVGGVEVSGPLVSRIGASTNFVSGVYDGSKIILYVDGINVGEGDASGALALSDSNLTIGSNGVGNFFNGSIDEVVVWNKIFSGEEMKSKFGLSITKVGQEEFLFGALRFFGEPPEETNYTYNVFITGTGGGLRGFGNRVIRNVGEGPQINFLGNSPEDEGSVNNDPVVFDLNIVDSGVGLEIFSLNLSRNGVSIAHNISTNGTFKTVYGLSEGSYSVNVTANDSFGFVSSVVRNFVVDRTDPEVVITSPSNTTHTVDDLFLRVVMNEKGNCEYDLDDDGREDFSESNGSIFNVSLDLDDGNHRIEIRCEDEAGNINNNEFIDFGVDTPSSVSNSNSSSSGGSSGSGSGSGSGSESGSGSGSGSESGSGSGSGGSSGSSVIGGTLKGEEVSFSAKVGGFVKDNWIILLLGFGILLLVIVISVVFVKFRKDPKGISVSSGGSGQNGQGWMPQSHSEIPQGIIQNNSVSRQGSPKEINNAIPKRNSLPSVSSFINGKNKAVSKNVHGKVVKEVGGLKKLKGLDLDKKESSDEFSEAERKIIMMGAKEFVKEAKRRGYDRKEIREKLKGKGWDDDELEDII